MCRRGYSGWYAGGLNDAVEKRSTGILNFMLYTPTYMQEYSVPGNTYMAKAQTSRSLYCEYSDHLAISQFTEESGPARPYSVL
jgi:hypothetical protein